MTLPAERLTLPYGRRDERQPYALLWLWLPLVAMASCGPAVDSSADAGGRVERYNGCPFRLPNGVDDVAFCPSPAQATAPGACTACTCTEFSCVDDDDCSLPRDGDAWPECRDGYCTLRCADGVLCPTGMECGQLLEDGVDVCVEALRDPLACGATGPSNEWPDICAAQNDPASCEGVPASHGFSCRWATKATYDVAAGDCTPVEPWEGCVVSVVLQKASDPCAAQGYCAASDATVSYEEPTPGMVRLTSVSGCGVIENPSADDRPRASCDGFGTTPVPIVCGCAC